MAYCGDCEIAFSYPVRLALHLLLLLLVLCPAGMYETHPLSLAVFLFLFPLLFLSFPSSSVILASPRPSFLPPTYSGVFNSLNSDPGSRTCHALLPPHYDGVRAMHFYREISSALPSLVDPRRVCDYKYSY